MKAINLRFLSSYRATLLLLMAYAILSALATVIEKYYGTPAAKVLIYYSPLFLLLQLLIVINVICLTIGKKLLRFQKWGYLTVHVSFIVILAGAMVTHLFSEEGMLHLRKGEKCHSVLMQENGMQKEHHFPFEVELTDFRLTRYPGSQSPSSYESLLRLYVDGKTLDKRVFMNNVLDIKGYRFFQASYDPDEQGTILSVSRDVTGRTVTYCGYGLLFIGLLGCFTDKNSRFRKLSRELKSIRIILFLGFLATPLCAGAQTEIIPVHHAEIFGSLPMQSNNGRIIPVNTFASEVLRKLQKKNEFEGLTPEQFLLGLFVVPEKWIHTPLIEVENAGIRQHYQLPEKRIAYRDAFDSKGYYRFGKDVETAYRKMPADRSSFDKELIKLDEKVNILHQLFHFQLIRLFPLPGDKNHKWVAPGDDLSPFTPKDSLWVIRLFQEYKTEVRKSFTTGNWQVPDSLLQAVNRFQIQNNIGLDISPKRMQTEIRYNKLNLFRHCRKGYLIIGGLLLLLSFSMLLKRENKPWQKGASILLFVAISILFLFHTYSIGMRWYIAGYAPWSNSYETMVCLAWVVVAGGMLFARRNLMACALATLLGGITLFVSGLSWMDPQINPLVPVLKSPWLMFHVATLIAAYGFLGISCMIGATNLVMYACLTEKNKEFLSTRILQLSIINEMSMLIGLALMTIGVFLGAIWANESWGRYWSWDPKETWALITTLIYAVVLHRHWFRKTKDARFFNLSSQWAFLTVLMTYFGVNYLLSGMHSYGNNIGLTGLPLSVYGIIGAFFILPVLLCYRK